MVIGVVGYFFAVTLANNWSEVAAEHLTFNPLWVVSIVIFAAAVPTTGLVWARMLRTLEPSARVGSAEAIAVQCLSWLLKYVPGQVGSVVNKVIWAGKRKLSRTLVIITFVYENVFLQLASIVPTVVILVLSLGPELFGQNAAVLIVPLLLLVPIALVMYAPFFRGVVNRTAKRVLKQDVPREYFLGSIPTLRFFIEFMGPRIFNGVGFVLIAMTVSPIGPGEWLPFAAAYVLAGAIGILAFFVPSGLGVREAVIVLILSQYIPVAEAIVISLLARLLSTVGDGLVALVYVTTRRMVPKEHRP
ncbi:lysylphosphatidylglycerol synthase domain-containing protein [Microbacterium cremeum]|uniref:lysylphosphatidylglycerol synthase domain-containing protein n=1 Tax=Microbacterium cremeum TaxID=2782169 RepID=UPI001887E1BA|nr:lysylphosphatidylglycerol synthase domain-containing protein [Microbacterium cremeum]